MHRSPAATTAPPEAAAAPPHRGTRAPLFLASALAGTLAFTGCVAGQDGGQPDRERQVAAQAERLAKPATKLWDSQDALLSQSLVVGQRVLAYTHEKNKLYLTARELHSGKLAWQRRAYPGNDPSGVPVGLDSVSIDGQDTVAVQIPDGQQGARLVVLNTDTGRQLAPGWGEHYWGSRPQPCATSWCTEGTNDSVNRRGARQYRFDASGGSWAAVPPAQLPVPLPDEDSRLLGHGLSATGQRGPNKEQLAYARNGKILWKQPYEKAFATEYSSDSGWTWTLASEPSDTLIGSGSRAHNRASSGTYLLDLASDYMSIAVDAASGTVLWRQPGAEAYCQGIFTDWVTDARRTVVLCTIDSGMSSILESDSDTRQGVLTGLKWRVTALDACTGAEQWSHGLPELKRTRELIKPRARILSDTEHAILPLPQGWRAIEIATGNVRELGQVLGQSVLCTTARETLELPIPGDREPRYLNGEDAIHPCDRDTLKPGTVPPRYAEFVRTGHHQQQVVVLAGTQGMTAYRMPPAEPAPGAPDVPRQVQR
ncbi:PQQ-binding-like beta-propeller repeat protein [Glutamicibacter sp. V16R2B1]|uniref:outer membrane protein assembly factor BamB family protein n=1 Tax=Glutamicibacter sp. V16R2B1 TaxID=2036207 RepID=UPI0010FE8B96|nr:PQQ-binding-like beta-propeller repeat protein [Glutamicibacter sp. V16R2B1]TLK49754.1 hypothetical protein FDN03_13145 [Glutamicibacter sp. V16R2B1]